MEITKGKIPCAKKIVVYGPEGIGKSTFAAKFPDPVFIDTEGSTKDMDVARLPRPSSWQMLMEEVQYVKEKNLSICKTMIIDTVDWAEQMCAEHVCTSHQKKGIEDFGYGKGYIYVKEEFGRFLNRLSDVVEAGVNVVLTAHTQLRKFEQPDEMGSYDRYELKLGQKTQSQTSPLVKEWADMLLFCNYKTYSVAVDDKGKKHKAQGGKRVMYTSHHPCWDAKNRYGLPDECEFDYSVIAPIIEGGTKPTAQPQKTEVKKQKDPTGSFMDIPEDAPEQMEFDTSSGPEKTEDKPPQNEHNPLTRSSVFHVSEKIPKDLRDLMEEKLVSEEEIQKVVSQRGYYPEATPITNYDPNFISGVLVGAWEQVYGMIEKMRETYEIPFDN